MQLNRCPVCHSRIGLEAMCQDEVSRELTAAVAAMSILHGSALMTYIGLFRSAKRDLANDRALRLVREVLELAGGKMTERVAVAMVTTVNNMREKQQAGEFKPLSNHNYLKKVFEDTPDLQPATAVEAPQRMGPLSKTAQSINALEGLKRGD